MPMLGGEWSLDQHEDYAGVVSLIVSGPDDDAPAFALHMEDGMIQSGVVVQDQYRTLGRDLRVEDGFRRIAAYLGGDRSLAA